MTAKWAPLQATIHSGEGHHQPQERRDRASHGDCPGCPSPAKPTSFGSRGTGPKGGMAGQPHSRQQVWDETRGEGRAGGRHDSGGLHSVTHRTSVTCCEMLWESQNKDCATSRPNPCGSPCKTTFRWILKPADPPMGPVRRVSLLPWDVDRGWKRISATIFPMVQVPASQPC